MTSIGRALAAYLMNVLVALDQLLNTILLGDPDETISSRVAKTQSHPLSKFIGNVLEYFDPGHLERTVEWDEGRKSVKGKLKDRQ